MPQTTCKTLRCFDLSISKTISEHQIWFSWLKCLKHIVNSIRSSVISVLEAVQNTVRNFLRWLSVPVASSYIHKHCLVLQSIQQKPNRIPHRWGETFLCNLIKTPTKQQCRWKVTSVLPAFLAGDTFLAQAWLSGSESARIVEVLLKRVGCSDSSDEWTRTYLWNAKPDFGVKKAAVISKIVEYCVLATVFSHVLSRLIL